MEPKSRLLNYLVLVSLIGAMVAIVIWLARPQSQRKVASFPAFPETPATLKTGSTSFSRIRKPKVAVPELPETGTNSFARALVVLQNAQASLVERRRAAFDLVLIATDESLAALQAAMPSLPPLVQAAAAEALGRSKHPRAPELLLVLWQHANDTTSRSIAMSLGRQGCLECLSVLRAALQDPSRSTQARGDAAAGLGISSDAGAYKLLTETFTSAQSTELTPQILSAIGQRPFAETREFFLQVLDAPGTESEMRLAALESLSNLPAGATDFLAKYLSDADAAIRAEAAWALSTTENPGHVGPQILNLLASETDAGVRLRLYQALANQENFDVNGALRATQAEPDDMARLAGFQALAGTEESRSTSELRAFLDQTAVPTLINSAIQGKDLPERLQAVMILLQVNSAASQEALRALKQNSKDEAIQQALRGLK